MKKVRTASYPSVYEPFRIGGNKVNCITATINKYFDGFGTRPFVMEIWFEEDSSDKHP